MRPYPLKVFELIKRREKNMRLQQIMTKEEAEKYIDEMADKLEIDILDFEVGAKSSEELKLNSDLLEGVMAGLIIYDDDKNCLTQKMTRKIKIGDYEYDTFHYRYKFKIKDARKMKDGGLENYINMLSKVCDVPISVLNELYGKNLEYAMACLDFFLR